MIINENGLTRAIKRAWKAGGYTVLRNGELVMVYSDAWCVVCPREIFPRKALGAIAEHAGFMPDDGEAYRINKGGDQQVENFQIAMDTVKYWQAAGVVQDAEMTRVNFSGYQLLQDMALTEGVRRLHGVSVENLDILEWAVARDRKAVVSNGKRAIYTEDMEAVALGLISGETFAERDEDRKAQIWAELEQTDLRS